MSLSDIEHRLQQACNAADRAREDVELIAVSKRQPNARIADVLAQGHRCFGENKVQEALEKWPGFQDEFGKVSLHLLGPLQSNKARQAMGLFDVIHSVDREKLARKIADLAQETGQCPALFVQVNTGAEPQKSGVLLEDLEPALKTWRGWDLPLTGLMCIPPVNEEAALHFALLKKLADRHGLPHISMGMSADFEKAVALGATHIRVGSAIFGARDYG